MSEVIQRASAKALIRHNGKLLLLREVAADGTQIGKYQIPGGMINPGEKYMDALLREVKEETGLDVKPIAPIMVDSWMPVIEGVQHQIVATFYLCEANTDKIILSPEHDDFVWIKTGEVSKYDVPSPVPELFAKYAELADKNQGER